MDAWVRWVERGWVPDPLVRAGIRRLLRERLRDERRNQAEGRESALQELVARMRTAPIALETRRANEQHYEVPPEFFRLVLGRRLKYSCCLWDPGTADLDRAEEAMLRITCERAGIQDGMRVLDLGCGWGSLSLWLAQTFPACRIVAVSNSRPQREFIEARCLERSLGNLQAITADMNRFEAPGRFDRVVSVEMFEHMRNYELLLRRIASWLAPGGSVFVHVFCHRDLAYFFETDGRNDWLARYFFTGGLMPSRDLIPRFRQDLETVRRWDVNGVHYKKTLLAWLELLDRRREEVLAVFRTVYGSDATVWFQRWRVFFLACAELFGYDRGEEWFVAHYVLEPLRG